jgi:hydroxyethylthiazole kinase
MYARASGFLEKVRSSVPLVLQITNYVTVNDCANATICIGGSPVMSDQADDASVLASISSAIVLNIGTVNERTLDIMIAAGKTANGAGAPVILDPVGVGASPYRTDSALRILEEVDVAVVKGNPGEIGILSGIGGAVRGVDSAGLDGDPAATVRSLSGTLGCTVAMTGATDYISDGTTTYSVTNGDIRLEQVSGTGCMTASVMGCFIGACKDDILGSATASLAAFSVAGELAASKCGGPGTFKMQFMDSLMSLDGDTLDTRACVRDAS